MRYMGTWAKEVVSALLTIYVLEKQEVDRTFSTSSVTWRVARRTVRQKITEVNVAETPKTSTFSHQIPSPIFSRHFTHCYDYLYEARLFIRRRNKTMTEWGLYRSKRKRRSLSWIILVKVAFQLTNSNTCYIEDYNTGTPPLDVMYQLQYLAERRFRSN